MGSVAGHLGPAELPFVQTLFRRKEVMTRGIVVEINGLVIKTFLYWRMLSC